MKGVIALLLSTVIMAYGQDYVCPLIATADPTVFCEGCTGVRSTVTVTKTTHPTVTYIPPCPTLPIVTLDEREPIITIPHPSCPPLPTPTATLNCRICTAIPTTTTVTTAIPTTTTVYRFCPLG